MCGIFGFPSSPTIDDIALPLFSTLLRILSEILLSLHIFLLLFCIVKVQYPVFFLGFLYITLKKGRNFNCSDFSWMFSSGFNCDSSIFSSFTIANTHDSK